ncbi:hypothetical protein [Mucilaginibacter agri]|uniref:hypothetical protein n=1 Tax=Mucilaginibacter agri TaxID=2695265 RepID=UPI001AA13155|nr:hypothetical protein [Mucilaginibacter agri]
MEDIPVFLDNLLKEFTNSSKLQDWQDGADDIMPSRLFEEENDVNHYKVISRAQALNLKHYYLKNELAAEIIEILTWVGISDLYVAFNSKKTFDCVMEVIEILNSNGVELPDFSIVSSCSINENGGWGNRVDMDTFLRK